jgi:hypothetical protein
MTKKPEEAASSRHDWSRLDAMTEAQRLQAALSDPMHAR